MRTVFSWLFICMWFLPGHGQTVDSVSVLGFDDVLQLIIRNHPVVRQANLQDQFAQAEVRMARGMLDPKLEATYDHKSFQDKEYYDLLATSLKVPTWFAIDPKVSVERREGDFLNPEDEIPDENNNLQVTAGIEVPLGRGLFIDERRNAIKQAEIYRNIAAAEQIKMSNKVLITVIKAYWDWQLSYQQLRLLEQSMDIALELFDRVLVDFEFGEASVVDTIQAKITYQTRRTEYEQVLFENIKARLALSVNLWSDESEPLEIRDLVIPDTTAQFIIPDSLTVRNLVEWSLENHPEIQKMTGKYEQLRVENAWARENLKPQVDLSYSLIDAPVSPTGEAASPTFNDNYKLGVDFAFPVFLRKERGKIQKTQLKMQANQFELQQLQQSIKNNILTKNAEIQMSLALVDQFGDMADNYNRLLEAELLNLETGESDLFKLNIQQDKYIESRLKFLKNAAKLQKNRAELLYITGLPYLSIPLQ